jgi:hypothetical protein
MKQTALQWLLEQWPILESQLPPAIINNALQMEREQIQDAFYHGVDIDAFNVHNKWTEAEKYYKQNFIGQDE